jgi:transcriptional regulator with XRE-family HTH domain
MARAALGWTGAALAEAASIGAATVARFELGENVQPDKVKAMRRALEDAGILFIDSGNLAGGVVPPRYA